MNVFVLCTGRCGSVTFAEACSHFTNFTSAHESRARCIGSARLDYPESHIEVDNRLSWFLGRLDRAYGNDAYYVHLKRDPEAVAVSYSRRIEEGIGRAYREAMIINGRGYMPPPAVEAMRDYVDTVTANIELFLKDKANVKTMELESIKSSFPQFCDWISAEGDLDAAMQEWDEKHNAASERATDRNSLTGLIRRARNFWFHSGQASSR